MTNTLLTITDYEELVRRVVKEIGMPIIANETLDNTCRRMAENNNEVMVTLNDFFKNIQACKTDINAEGKRAIRDSSFQRFHAAINLAKQK